MQRKRQRRMSKEVLKKLIEVAQDIHLSYDEIMKRVPVSRHQILRVANEGKIPWRSRERKHKKLLIKIAQDPNLTYKEIIRLVPDATPREIQGALQKGQIPRRNFDPDKLYTLHSNGGLRSAMVRWGYNDNEI